MWLKRNAIKILSKKIVALSTVGCLTIPFFSTTASAKLHDKNSYNLKYKCTLVSDENDIMYIKRNPKSVNMHQSFMGG